MRLSRKLFGDVAVTSLFASAGSVARALFQACYLIIVTRLLGASGYGSFTGIVAIGVIGAPLAGWGMPWVLIEELSQRPAMSSRYMSIALACTAVTGLAMVPVALLLFYLADGQAAATLVVALLIFLAELVLTPLAGTLSNGLLARGHRARMSLLAFIVPAARFVTALTAFLVYGTLTLPTLAATHLVATVAGCLIAWLVAAPAIGPLSRFTLTEAIQSMRRGTSYALGNAVALGYSEIDKPLQVALIGARQTGLYTAAYRIVNALSIPIWGVTTAALPKLFRTAADRRGNIALMLILSTAAYSGVAIALVWAVSSYITLLLGPEFGASASICRWLTLWLPLFAIHQSCGTVLQTSGRRPLKIAIESVGLLLIGGANVLLDPSFGIFGSIVALLVTELFLAATMAIVIVRSRPAGGPPSEAR